MTMIIDTADMETAAVVIAGIDPRRAMLFAERIQFHAASLLYLKAEVALKEKTNPNYSDYWGPNRGCESYVVR